MRRPPKASNQACWKAGWELGIPSSWSCNSPRGLQAAATLCHDMSSLSLEVLWGMHMLTAFCPFCEQEPHLCRVYARTASETDKQWMRAMEVQAMKTSVMTIALSKSDAAYLQQLLSDQDHQQQQQLPSQIQVLLRFALCMCANELSTRPHFSSDTILSSRCLELLHEPMQR